MKKHDKEEVISIGERLFRSQGYHNTGTEDILLQSGYPRSSFYYHFKSKEGFACAVLQHYGNNAEQFYRTILTRGEPGSPFERLRHFAHLMINTSEKKQFKSECLIQKFSIECAGINEALRESAESQLDKLLNVLAGCISAGQAENEIRTDLEALELAEFFLSQIYGCFILARLRHNAGIMRANMDMALQYLQK